MRESAEETDLGIQKNMVTSQSERRFAKHSMSRRNCMRAESGTCSLCSAPCSSCMHLNLALMGSKTEEFSDETCRETTGSQYSINEGDVLHSFKRRACDSLQLCEASNLLSVNSSHDSFSVNAEINATLRSSDVSDASEDFEMHPKFSSRGAGAKDQISPKPGIGLDQRFSSNKYDDAKGAEGHDDNISCLSRANVANAAVSDHDRCVNINLSHSSASVCSLGPEGLGKAESSLKLELSEKKVGASCGSPNVQSLVSHYQNNKCLVEDSSEALTKVYPKSEADSQKASGDPRDEALKCSVEDKQYLKSTHLDELPDEQPLQAASVDEAEESDFMEHDVKVCDICGDAGREHLLAICSMCSDGAEHTYCMKEMLQQVPEGDWLCEECEFAEEAKKQKQGEDLEGKRTNKPSTSTHSSGKRHAENLEAAPAAKRQAIETSLGSPKPLSPGKTAALSRDGSFKSLDKGKVRPASFGNNSINDVESALSPRGLLPQTSKGTLLKSSSFSTLNPKAKEKLVDEVVPHRQKGTRGQASLDVKEGPTRVMSKSMSFKSASSGRSSAGESKFRALSPRPHVHDLKGLKQVNERNAFERKNLSRLDRALTASSMATSASTPKVDQKLTPRGEAVSLSPASNNRESKVVKSEGKGSTLTKSNSNLARKDLEASVTLVGASSMSAMCSSSVEREPNLVSPKEEPSSSSSWTAEKPSTNANETMQDALPQSLESKNQGEKSSSCHSGPTLIAGSKGALCQKCKEMGHDVESCPLGSPQVSGIEVSAGRNTWEDNIKGNKLKVAIEVAMHKLPGTYGRNKVNDQSEGLGVANMDLNCERSSQDQFSISNKMKGTHEIPINKETTVNHLKPFAALATDVVFPLRAGDSISVVPFDGKPSMVDWPGHALAETAALLKISAVPEHEYIWQGGFEVHRGGEIPVLCGGIQAHLSSCASPKVIEMANKFPQRIQLNEVPRVCTWPTVFHESGAKEDNIALYFFAKDYESYERNYKGLVDSLIKNDLALKGNLDGVELLIFPSSQLPENCQRWNMLFFLWGVFRVRKIICLPKHADTDSAAFDASHKIVPGSYGPDKRFISMNGSYDIKVSSLQQTSLGSHSNSAQQDGRFDSRFSSRAASSVALLSAEMRCASPSLRECNLSEGGLGTEVKPSLQAIRTSVGSGKGGMTEMDGDSSLGEVSSLSKNFHVGKEGVRDEGSVDAEKVPDITKSGRDQVNFEIDLNEGGVDADKMPVMTKCGRYQIDLERDLNEGSVDPEEVPDTMKSGRDLINLERDLNNGSSADEKPPGIFKKDRGQIDLERDLKDDMYINTETSLDRNQNFSNLQQSNHRNSHHLDLLEIAAASSCGTSQNMPWNEALVDGDSRSDGFLSRREDLSSSSSNMGRSEAFSDKKAISKDLGSSERYFFPVDSHRVNDFRLGADSIPWKELSSKGEDRVPNLELALGADNTKQPNKGMLPFFVGPVDKNNNQDKPPDKQTDKGAEEDISASLSLSLSFPIPDKEQTSVKPASKTERLLPESRRVNTSRFLFGDK